MGSQREEGLGEAGLEEETGSPGGEGLGEEGRESPGEGEELWPRPPALPGDLLCCSRWRRAACYSGAGSTPSSSRRWAVQRVQEGCRRARGEEQTGRRKRQKVKEGDPNPGSSRNPGSLCEGHLPPTLGPGEAAVAAEAISEAGVQEGQRGAGQGSPPLHVYPDPFRCPGPLACSGQSPWPLQRAPTRSEPQLVQSPRSCRPPSGKQHCPGWEQWHRLGGRDHRPGALSQEMVSQTQKGLRAAWQKDKNPQVISQRPGPRSDWQPPATYCLLCRLQLCTPPSHPWLTSHPHLWCWSDRLRHIQRCPC